MASLNVLFLCTGNSARSILAEALLNHLPAAAGRFAGFSAGSQPRGEVHPRALAVLAGQGIPTEGLRSKSWDEFAAPGAPRMDIVVTVCDSAARETCPVWPGHPATAHWSVPDPASAASADDPDRPFLDAFRTLRRRIELLAGVPADTLTRLALKARLDQIASA